MNLDCESEAARPFMEGERAASRAFCKFHGFPRAYPSSNKAAAVDRAIIGPDNKIVALAEVKSRRMSLGRLEQFGSYLITEDKLWGLVAASQFLGIPGYLIVYLMESGHVCWWKITEGNGTTEILFHPCRTKTQATCNGGEAERLNAYIELTTMNIIETTT